VRRLTTQAYSEAERIDLVRDNLDTHHMEPLYEIFLAQEARELPKLLGTLHAPKGQLTEHWGDRILRNEQAVPGTEDRLDTPHATAAPNLAAKKKRRRSPWRFTTDSGCSKLRRQCNAVRDQAEGALVMRLR
jgi:hypothetical protein